MNPIDDLEKKIDTLNCLERFGREYWPEAVGGLIIGTAAAFYREMGENPDFVSLGVPFYLLVGMLHRGTRYFVETAQKDQSKIEESLRSLKREISFIGATTVVFYGSYLF